MWQRIAAMKLLLVLIPVILPRVGSLLTELVISILAAVVNTKEGLRLVTSQLLM